MRIGRSKMHWWNLIGCLLIFAAHRATASSGDIWPLERPEGMPAIQSLEVMCGKDHMDVHLSFTHPFEGIVSSKGQYADPRCVYVPPSTGKTFFSFRIAYARCGTKPDLHGQFYENTVVVQYDKDLLEVWDEAKRLRCEWFNDYEKTASKPPMVIADLDVIQLDFRGDNVDCWMEIQHGKGPWAPPVSGIVPLGSTLTLVVAINDYRSEFDMRVKSCAASDGDGHVIQLSDEQGCVLRPKMISRFLKARTADERASAITYAFFHAFKFPDALSVHIKCKVEICRHGCLDHCQLDAPHVGGHSPLPAGHYGPLERKDQQTDVRPLPDQPVDDLLIYDDLIQEGGEETLYPVGVGMGSSVRKPSTVHAQAQQQRPSEGAGPHKEIDDRDAHARPYQQQRPSEGAGPHKEIDDRDAHARPYQQQRPSEGAGPHKEIDDSNAHARPYQQQRPSEGGVAHNDHDDAHTRIYQEPPRPTHRDGQERFPHGPRHLSSDDVPIIGAASPSESTPTPGTERRRRSVVVSDRKARSADVGVSGLYEVISEVDLAFTPDSRAEAVTVFQGRIREEVVYGICLPVPGFSVLFVLAAVSAVVSALVAGSLLYRYQLQREAQAQGAKAGSMMMTSLASWMAVRLARTRPEPTVVTPDTSPTASSHEG